VAVLYKLNCGNTYPATGWSSDLPYLIKGDDIYSTVTVQDNSAVPECPTEVLQDHRWAASEDDPLTYQFDVSGYVTVDLTLYFSEIYHTATGAGWRYFDIYINSALVTSNYDVADEAGGLHTGVKLTFTDIDASSGTLTLELARQLRAPMVSGIVIEGDTSTATPKSVSGTLTTSGTVARSFIDGEPPPDPSGGIHWRSSAAGLRSYLESIPPNKWLVGQFPLYGTGNTVTSSNNMLEEIYSNTGYHVAMTGADLGAYSASKQQVIDWLIDKWGEGYIVTLSYHMKNPYTGGSSSSMDLGGMTLAQLRTYQPYLNIIDEAAGYLQQLHNAGVKVIWRPFHEMNGGWFWWFGSGRTSANYNNFRLLWQHMYDRFTNTFGLTEMLWAFSPNRPYDQYRADIPNWYPGHDYVDIVSTDYYGAYYNNPLDIEGYATGYQWLVDTGKPYLMLEFGPRNTGPSEIYPNTYDTMRLVNDLEDYYPLVKGVMFWEWVWSLTHPSQSNVPAMMAHPNTITREDLPTELGVAYSKSVSDALTLNGAVTRSHIEPVVTPKSVSGGLDLSGAVSTFAISAPTPQAAAGALSFSGALSTLLVLAPLPQPAAGELDLSGTVATEVTYAPKVDFAFHEDFEPVGYRQSGWSKSVTGAAILNEDYDTTPLGEITSHFGNQCLYIYRPATGGGAITRNTLSSGAAVSYWRFEVIVGSIAGLPTNNPMMIAQVDSSSLTPAFDLLVYHGGNGNPIFQLTAFGVDGVTKYYNAPVGSLNRRYTIEVKWDRAANEFEWRIDGNTRNTGTITGAALNTARVSLGVESWLTAPSQPVYYYVDNVTLHEAGWPSEVTAPSGVAQSTGGVLNLSGALTAELTDTLTYNQALGGSTGFAGILRRTYLPGGATPPDKGDEEPDPVQGATAYYEVFLYPAQGPTEPFILGSATLGTAVLDGEYYTNHDLTRLEDWTYLSFTQKLNDSNFHQIRFDLSPLDPKTEFLREMVGTDNIIEIWRYDLITGVRKKVYEGFNRTIVDQARVTGTLIFNLYGSGYTELLKRRQVVPPIGLEAEEHEGPAETVAKQFVWNNMFSPQYVRRAVKGLEIEPDLARGNTVSFRYRYVNLFTVITNCAEQGDIDFGIVAGPEKGQYVFEARPLWGSDRRQFNPEGNPPTIFSLDLGNMSIPINSENTSEEVNALFVGGVGDGVARLIREVAYTERVEASPWNRREGFYDVQDGDTVEILRSEGAKELMARRAEDTLTFNVLETASCRWLVHWELGDLVTAFYAGKRFDKQIKEVSVTVTGAGESQREVINAELDDYTPPWVELDVEVL